MGVEQPHPELALSRVEALFLDCEGGATSCPLIINRNSVTRLIIVGAPVINSHQSANVRGQIMDNQSLTVLAAQRVPDGVIIFPITPILYSD